jgi:hypothetical protein
MEPTQLGPIDRVALCPETCRYQLKTETESSLRNIVTRTRMMDNVLNLNSSISLLLTLDAYSSSKLWPSLRFLDQNSSIIPHKEYARYIPNAL